ncbi:hypothetical protein L2E82_51628 [Cichorium intybus]|nr:hypothetical protein L2E82_51628 [Cichorium intybus]
MSRRPGNPTRRFVGGNSNSLAGIIHSKSRASPVLVVIILLGGFLVLSRFYQHPGGSRVTQLIDMVEGDFGCTFDVQTAIPVLKKVYGNNMKKVLHVGPDTCSIVSRLIKEHKTEAWGVEPYDLEDANTGCKKLVKRGLVRVADIKFALPYRPKSFSLIVISDVVDYLSPRYLNKTLSDLTRLSTDNLVIFTGHPGDSRGKTQHFTNFGRPAKMRSATWWARFFVQTNLEENEAAAMKFEKAAFESSYKPKCQVFHLHSYQ